MTPDELGNILFDLSDHTVDPQRPFTGQPHTDQGNRGKTEVKGIRFRDLADCVAKAWIDAAVDTIDDDDKADELRKRAEDNTLTYNDLYLLEVDGVDPVALIQNVSCRVEKAMGIFPNVPRLGTAESPDSSPAPGTDAKEGD